MVSLSKVGFKAAGPEELPVDTYDFWRQALLTDDHLLVAEILDKTKDVNQIQRLLNGHFVDGEPRPIQVWGAETLKKIRDVSFDRPWCLAGASGSLKVLSVLYKYGVDVHQKDRQGSNILHLLIYMSFNDPNEEQHYCTVYCHLQDLLSTDELLHLLKSEGYHHLYPLEMAAWLSTFGMLQTIFNTDGIYHFSEDIDGVWKVDKYDVTDYECKERRTASPLPFLLFMDDAKTTRPETRTLFQSGMVQNWLTLKTQSSKYLIFVWLFTRLLYVTVYLLYDAAGGWTKPLYAGIQFNNQTSPAEACDVMASWVPDWLRLALAVYLMIHSSIIVLSDIVEAVILVLPKYRKHTCKYFKTPNGNKYIRSPYMFYRVCQLTMALSCLFGSSSSFIFSYTELRVHNYLTNLLYTLMSLNLIWSILFFVQLAPILGYFVFSIQCMISDLINFIILFVAFAFTYSTAFAHIINEDKTTGTCPAEWNNTGISFYTTFTAMVNMVDFQSYSVKDGFNLFLIHVIYIFMVAILLLNFLIAQFSATVSHVLDNKVVYTTGQWLSIICSIDFRLNYLNNNWNDHRKSSVFLVEDNRVLVPVLSVKPMMDSDNDRRGFIRNHVTCSR